MSHGIHRSLEIQTDGFSAREVDNNELDAKVIGFDTNSDIAVLKINLNKDLVPISIGSSESLRVGDEVLAIGNPYGIGISVSSGIISATGREYGNPYLNLIQTERVHAL